MQKTKIGISVNLLGAAVFFAALFGGYTPVILLAGYVLLFEENEWLKKASVKAVALLMWIGVLLAAIGLIPDFLSWVGTLFSVFDVNFSYVVIGSIISVITKAISIGRTCLFLVLGMKALNQGTVAVPFVDGLVNKYV